MNPRTQDRDGRHEQSLEKHDNYNTHKKMNELHKLSNFFFDK